MKYCEGVDWIEPAENTVRWDQCNEFLYSVRAVCVCVRVCVCVWVSGGLFPYM